jgi:hypothetical protein
MYELRELRKEESLARWITGVTKPLVPWRR